VLVAVVDVRAERLQSLGTETVSEFAQRAKAAWARLSGYAEPDAKDH